MQETASTRPNSPRRRRQSVEWSDREKAAWQPPERLTVSEWADERRIMDSKSSAFPGKWRTDRTPYLREPMDAFNDPAIEDITICTGTQVGKTEVINNMVGYAIDQEPNPGLIVYPTLTLAEFSSENRIRPMIQQVPELKEKYDERGSARLELQFSGMYLALSGANSPASLASRPVRYVFFDEVDKFPDNSGKEADPVSLAKERTKTFYNRKHVAASTPTFELGPIWQLLVNSDVIKQYYVPCPHCGHYQTLKLKQITWPDGVRDPQVVQDTAYYICEACGFSIEDKHKPEMLRFGEWRPVTYDKGKWLDAELTNHRIRKVGFHLNSIYSPWLSFGDIAAEFLRSKDFPEKLRNFVNSWLGEPWRDKTVVRENSTVLANQSGYSRGVIPKDCLLLTAGVDIQLDHMWWEIRAWGERISSWLVDYGRCETWDELQEILVDRVYKDDLDNQYIVQLALIDSGYRTDEVYEFCAYHPDVAKPSKGSSKRMTAPFSVSKVEKAGWEGLKLWMVDTHYYKDLLDGRIRKPKDEPGAWMVFDGCPIEYGDHIVSEQKVTVVNRRTGQATEEWTPIASHATNHLLDCAVYSTCAAEIMGVRYLYKPDEKQEAPSEASPPEQNEETRSAWVPRRDNWFRR